MSKKEETLYILDTSAILSFIEDEKGADRVEEILNKRNFIIPFIVYLETYYISLREKGLEIGEKRYAMLKKLGGEYIDYVPEPVLLKAGLFKSKYNVSLADSIIAAFASIRKAILVHKDPEYEILEKIIKEERLPYKKPQSTQNK